MEGEARPHRRTAAPGNVHRDRLAVADAAGVQRRGCAAGAAEVGDRPRWAAVPGGSIDGAGAAPDALVDDAREAALRDLTELQGFRMPSTAEEDHEFEALRTRIRTRMRQALPLWVQRLAEDGTGKGRKARLERARQAQLWGVEMFAQAQARVQCKEPVDKIQALLPMFLNTPVQDLLELLELSHRGAKLAEECRLSEEAKAAMATAKELVRGAFFAEQRCVDRAELILFRGFRPRNRHASLMLSHRCCASKTAALRLNPKFLCLYCSLRQHSMV